MAVYDLEEQEQISQLKGWWEDNGKFVTAVIVVVALISVGWQGMRWHQNKQSTGASALYAAVEQGVSDGDADRVREQTGQILAQYPNTAYASMAALLSAKAQHDADDVANARIQLQWVIDKGGDPFLRELARLHLATIALDEGEYQQGLSLLSVTPSPSLLARFEDLRGDLLAADQKPQEARQAYQAALDALAAEEFAGGSGAMRDMVRLKQESLEG